MATLLASFPEAATLFWGDSTHLWRALVRIDGRDDWVTADTLEHLGHALWTLLRTRRPSPGPHPHARPRRVRPAPPAPPLPAASRGPVQIRRSAADDYWPGLGHLSSSQDPGPRRPPGLLARLGDRVRSWRAA
ncbi:hypothetical protein [Actinocorallia herbida]|nr:hypothetical protein [Actinocorallia herbida]